MSALQLLLWVSICARPGLVIAQQEASPAPTPHKPKPKTPDGPGGPDQGGTRATTGHTTTAGRGNAPAGNRGGSAHQPAGTRNVSLKGGGHASVRSNGSIRSVDRNGMHIEAGVRGGRTVVSERNGARIVTTGHGGYVQRAYVTRGGHAYYSRTFYVNGHYSVGIYRGYGWGGHMYYVYYSGVW
ncbi:MAG: hypothetical protein WA254_22885 [Candidatus Sulfotelmatobacter sp.]